MMKGIVLCADDYGQAPAINNGILALLLKNRLSAVSCLVNMPLWPEAAASLIQASSAADIGLHFNLTEGGALSAAWQTRYGEQFPSLNSVLRRSVLRQWNQGVIVAELEAQLDAFQAATGQLPRFIDGHQHVHQFAVIREAVLSVYEKRLRENGAYMRLAQPKIRNFKQIIIVLTGALAFRRRLHEQAIPHNASFSGSYSFADLGHYPERFQAFLGETGDGGLIMCHPGLQAADGDHDLIAQARFEEYRYLVSDQFLEDCVKNGVKIGQFAAKAKA